MALSGIDWQPVLIPVVLILAMVALVAAVTLLDPPVGWVVAYYPDGANALVQSAAYAEAIATVSASGNAATVLATSTAQQSALRQNGAILLDPEGVPLCSNP